MLVTWMLAGLSVLFAMLFSLLVLLLMFGPEDLERDIERHKHSVLGGQGGPHAQPDYLLAFNQVDLGEPTGDEEFDGARGQLAALALGAERAWFEPMFWFFLLGPCGAVLYRLVDNLLRDDGDESGLAVALTQVREIMEWLPARISAIALGIAGTLVPVLDTFRRLGPLHFPLSRELVARAALAAIDHGRIRDVISGDAHLYRINQMHALVKRAMMAWLVFIALLALAVT